VKQGQCVKKDNASAKRQQQCRQQLREHQQSRRGMGILSNLVMLLRGMGANNSGGKGSDNDDAKYNNARPGGGDLALMINGKDN
jgi:hypothetical protein